MDKTWPITDSIFCQQLTDKYLLEAVQFMETAFYPHENVCKVIGVSNDPDALLELGELTTATAKDGVTLIAIDRTTNIIVGAAFNKLQVRGNPAFEKFAESWKQKKSKAVVEFMAEIDKVCDLFDYCKVDCLLELMFLATSPEYRGRGIGKKLTEISIEIGSNLANEINVKRSVDGRKLSLEPAPKIISAICTSNITQKIANSLGFHIVVEKNFNELEYEGRKYSDVIGSGTPFLTLVYKEL